MTFSESEFSELFKNEIKKVEFPLRRGLISQLFNFDYIKSPFWPPSGYFSQILISAIDSSDENTPIMKISG